MRKLFLIALVFSGIAVHGQKIANPKPFEKQLSEENLKKNLYIVAGEEMQGRETASEGERKAAAFIEEQFKKYGLQPGFNGSYLQPFPLYTDSLTHSKLSVNSQSFAAGKDYSFSLSANHSSNLYFSEAIFAAYGSDADYSQLEVKGKLVIVLADNRPAQGRRGSATLLQQEAAIRNGAAALLIINNAIMPIPPKGGLYPKKYQKTVRIPTYAVNEAIAKAITGKGVDELTQKTADTVPITAQIDLEFAKSTQTVSSYNVLGLLEGSDLKDEYVVITSHYDHMGAKDGKIWYGADDDGSGTVAVIELAKAFSAAKAKGKGPRRSILFMPVSGEEKGLWGSAYYGENPVYPLEKTTVNLNIDMIGRIDPSRTHGDSTNYVYIVGDDKLSSDLKPISEAVNKKYTKLELDYKYNDPNDPMRIYYRSDHYNFAKHGVPIIFYFNGLHDDYHQPTDTPDKINYPLLRKRTALVFYTAWEMANRNELLKRDIPLQ